MSRQVVYIVTKDAHGNSVWQRAGSMWENRDGSLNVYLDVLPLDGKLHIRPTTLSAPQSYAPSASPNDALEVAKQALTEIAESCHARLDDGFDNGDAATLRIAERALAQLDAQENES